MMRRWSLTAGHRRASALRGSDDAVSSVIGTVMMVSVTVIVFGGVAALVFDEVGDQQDNETSQLVARANSNTALVLHHNGGERVPLSQSEVTLKVNGVSETHPLTVFSAQTADGANWVIGESLCIVGKGGACLYGSGVNVTSVQIVYSNNLVLDYSTDNIGVGSGGGSGGGGGGEGVGDPDPGFSYEDADGDGVYDEGEVTIPYDDLKNGYDAGADALVISASTNGGTLEPDSDAVWSADGGITLHANVIADGNQALTFISANGDVSLDPGLTVQTNSGGREIVVDAGGDVLMDGVSIDAGTGFIRIGDSSYLGEGYVGGKVSLVGATLEARKEISIKAAGDIDVQSATFRQGTNPSASVLLAMDDTADTIFLDNSEFMRFNSDAPIDVDLEPDHDSGHVNGTPTTYESYK